MSRPPICEEMSQDMVQEIIEKKIAMTERVATQKFVTTFYRRNVCAACMGDLGQPVCFALGSKWAKNRCSFHAKLLEMD